jgi:two-component system, LuxR family, response regulator FixJ
VKGGCVYLIDDDGAMRDSLSFLLSTQGLKVHAYESPERFLRDAANLDLGCIVTDMRMPEMSGLQLVRRLVALGVTAPVIVITGHGDVPLAVEAMKAGVVDFIEKPFSDDVIIAAINAALAGIANQSKQEAERADTLARIATLTGREHEVMQALVVGRANKVIADDLGISARTVEIYRANVMSKMKASSLSELVRLAITSGAF